MFWVILAILSILTNLAMLGGVVWIIRGNDAKLNNQIACIEPECGFKLATNDPAIAAYIFQCHDDWHKTGKV